uniref:RNA polymerase subunit beta n=1 Tax=Prototheca lentecrescens TaxID=2836214 RepID=UPI003001CF55
MFINSNTSKLHQFCYPLTVCSVYNRKNKNLKTLNNTLNSLLYDYIRLKKKKQQSNILKLLPNLLNIQQHSFQHFIENDISLALDNFNSLKIQYHLFSFEITFFSKYLYFNNKKKTILDNIDLDVRVNLEGTYGCQVFLPILLRIEGESKNFFDWLDLGFLPFLLKSGHFKINGISRVILNQLVRLPGVYKLQYQIQTASEIETKPFLRIVPDMGNWITIHFDIQNRLWLTIKTLKKKISLLIFLQALGFQLTHIFQNIRFSEILLSSIVPPLKFAGSKATTRHDTILLNASLYSHPLNQKEAIRYIYAHYLEYNQLEKNEYSKRLFTEEEAFSFFHQMVWNAENRYLGVFCRKQFSEKIGVPPLLHSLELIPEDFLYLTQTILNLLNEKEIIDDIDDLTNKTIRDCSDYLYQELMTGLAESEVILNRKFAQFVKSEKKKKLEYSIQSSIPTFIKKHKSILTASITKNWNNFFVSGTLSQYLDETNPLAEITHKRRLTFLGPEGITEQQATIKIRGIHPTYYGRICPIETPEGQNAGLVHSFTVFSYKTIDGRLTSPYFQIFKGQIQKRLGFKFLSREDESVQISIPADITQSKWGLLSLLNFPIRQDLNFDFKPLTQITVQSFSVLQMISIATSSIPFLEHDDANRALMGSNMQRQAVILLKAEIPSVKTHINSRIVSDVNQLLQAENTGIIFDIDSTSLNLYNPKKIASFNCVLNSNNSFFSQSFSLYSTIYFQRQINKKINIKQQLNYFPFFTNIKKLEKGNKFKNLYSKFQRKKKEIFEVKQTIQFDFLKENNQGTCGFQRPVTKEMCWIEKSALLVDNGASIKGNLALGQNVFVAYLPWEGYNFEDAVLISEALVTKNFFSSLHLETYKIEIQNTPLGPEKITKNVPLLSSTEILQVLDLDSRGIIQKGKWVKEGDYLVGKIRPSSNKTRGVLAQYEKFYNLFFKKEQQKREEEKKAKLRINQLKEFDRDNRFIENLNIDFLGLDEETIEKVKENQEKEKKNPVINTSFRVPKGVEGLVIDLKVFSFQSKEEDGKTPQEIVLSVHITLLQHRKIKVGDKVAGRHGNKGIISKILPVENMPYLPDGTPIDVVLNPLGIPSRMNVGQVLECLLGLAGKYLNESYTIHLFDEKFGKQASRSFVYSKLYEASLKTKKSWLFEPKHPGKVKIFDGRTGLAFHQPVTVGYTYMLKLIHMVDDKIHARATGPYSRVTQQPVRGRAQNGGQRVGEMEVWAFQAYGAAFTLQEILTIKSDDVDGRKSATSNIVLNQPVEIKQPESVKMILREIQSLCMNLELYVPSYSKNNFKKLSLIDLNDLDTNFL